MCCFIKYSSGQFALPSYSGCRQVLRRGGGGGALCCVLCVVWRVGVKMRAHESISSSSQRVDPFVLSTTGLIISGSLHVRQTHCLLQVTVGSSHKKILCCYFLSYTTYRKSKFIVRTSVLSFQRIHPFLGSQSSKNWFKRCHSVCVCSCGPKAGTKTTDRLFETVIY